MVKLYHTNRSVMISSTNPFSTIYNFIKRHPLAVAGGAAVGAVALYALWQLYANNNDVKSKNENNSLEQNNKKKDISTQLNEVVKLTDELNKKIQELPTNDITNQDILQNKILEIVTDFAQVKKATDRLIESFNTSPLNDNLQSKVKNVSITVNTMHEMLRIFCSNIYIDLDVLMKNVSNDAGVTSPKSINKVVETTHSPIIWQIVNCSKYTWTKVEISAEFRDNDGGYSALIDVERHVKPNETLNVQKGDLRSEFQDDAVLFHKISSLVIQILEESSARLLVTLSEDNDSSSLHPKYCEVLPTKASNNYKNLIGRGVSTTFVE